MGKPRPTRKKIPRCRHGLRRASSRSRGRECAACVCGSVACECTATRGLASTSRPSSTRCGRRGQRQRRHTPPLRRRLCVCRRRAADSAWSTTSVATRSCGTGTETRGARCACVSAVADGPACVSACVSDRLTVCCRWRRYALGRLWRTSTRLQGRSPSSTAGVLAAALCPRQSRWSPHPSTASSSAVNSVRLCG